VTRGLGRRSGAAAALILAFLLGTSASPAGADPVLTVDKPAAAAVLDTASVTISGTANVSDALLDTLTTIKRVTVTLGTKSLLSKDCMNAKSCPFSTSTSLALNGPYKVTVVATEANVGLEGASTTVERSFAVAAPAAKPVVDPPKILESRAVQLSWTRNPEGDFLYYAVFRKDPGATKYFQVGGKVLLPDTGKPTFTDSSTLPLGGGDYSYQVVAVRKGATGTATSEKLSDLSTAVIASVPVPPTTTSTTTAAGIPGQPAVAGPTTTVKPAPPAGVDLSGFLSARSQPITLPKITVPEPPDTGFQGTLPFGARPPGDDLEEGDAEATSPNSGNRDTAIVSIATGRPLVPIAGGLVLLLLAVHMRLLSRRVKAPADADLPVMPAPLRAPAVTTAAITARPAPAKAPAPPPKAPAPPPKVDDAIPVADDEAWAPPPPAAAPARPEPPARPRPRRRPPVDAAATPAPPAPAPPTPDAEDIEVVEVVSSTRRPLARAGAR